MSAQNFTITAATPQLFVTYPNGGEVLYPGTSVGIYWTNNYVPGSFVKLEYSTDSGVNWTTIVTNTSLTSGYYNWAFPNIPTTKALVRVTSSSLPNVMDTSNAVFTIRPFITITSPNSPGISYPSCSNQYIYLDKSSAITYVKVEYSTDSMASWTTYSSSYYVGGSNSTSVSWSVPSLFTNNLFLRVSDVSFPTRLDVSDYPVVVRGDSSIVLNSPNGGETWQGGTYQFITWAGNATVSGRYQVEYSINNGVTWNLLTSSTYATSYYWLLPNTPTTTARVRITDFYNTCKNAVSNQAFTITAATPTLVVSYPNGGEGLYPGTTVSISWNSAYLPTSNIKLEYHQWRK